MKKQLLYISVAASFFMGSLRAEAQCLEASFGQYPDDILLPECVGAPSSIVSDAYAGEYSFVQLTGGTVYQFSSSIATDYITISNEAGTEAIAFGISPVTYTPTESIVVRFFTHIDAACGDENEIRARRVQCGTIPDCEPVAVPYSQGFEVGQTACITYFDVNDSTGDSGWQVNNFFPTDFGERSMLYTYDSDLPGDDWFFTEGLTLAAITTYNLQFQYRSGLGPETVENLEVKFGNAPTVAAMETTLLTYEGLETNFGDDFATADVSFTTTSAGTYYIGFHSFSEPDQGYIQIDDITVDANLATDAFDKSAFAAYPNPVKDELNFKNAGTISSVNIYNLLGQQVFEQYNPSSKINLSGLETGVYIVKLTAGTEIKSFKIIKQ